MPKPLKKQCKHHFCETAACRLCHHCGIPRENVQQPKPEQRKEKKAWAVYDGVLNIIPTFGLDNTLAIFERKADAEMMKHRLFFANKGGKEIRRVVRITIKL